MTDDRAAERDSEEFCYVTTVGRQTGRPHSIEIWFTARADSIYVLAGGGTSADFVQNVLADPSAVVKIADRAYRATGRVADEEESAFARSMIPAKYAHRESGLEDWAKTALPIAFELRE
jgi:deazaflavin-dependent oxidoreductase (nitroreductase family)